MNRRIILGIILIVIVILSGIGIYTAIQLQQAPTTDVSVADNNCCSDPGWPTCEVEDQWVQGHFACAQGQCSICQGGSSGSQCGNGQCEPGEGDECPKDCTTGGDSCSGTAHCSNNKKDCNETGTDCGGGCKSCTTSGGGGGTTGGGGGGSTANKSEGDSCTPGQSDPAKGGCDGPGTLSCIVCPGGTVNAGAGVCIDNFNTRTGAEVAALCGGYHYTNDSACLNITGKSAGDSCQANGDSGYYDRDANGNCSCTLIRGADVTCDSSSLSNCGSKKTGNACIAAGNASGICLLDLDSATSCICEAVGAGGTATQTACEADSNHFWTYNACDGLAEAANGCQDPNAQPVVNKPALSNPGGDFCGWVQVDCESPSSNNSTPEFFESQYFCNTTDTTGGDTGGDTGEPTTPSGGTAPYCGDGIVNNGEACDYKAPGETTATCNENCAIISGPTQPFCGDAICRAGEYCERQSAGSSTFISCTTNQVVSECRNILSSFSANQAADACTYCGDGTLQTGEQCDYNASGETAETCNTSCQVVNPPAIFCGDGIVNGTEECDYNAPGESLLTCDENCENIETPTINDVCVSLADNLTGQLTAGPGNTIEYTLTYTSSTTGDPYPSIKLVVGNVSSGIGRDAYINSQNVVSPYASPSAGDASQTKVYKFLWDAANTDGSDVANGTYNVQVLLNGTAGSVVTTTACQESLLIDASLPEESNFIVTKTGSDVCLTNGSVRVDYTVTVTNVGPATAVYDQITDTLDSDIVALGIQPQNMNPSYGTYSGGVITWVGTAAQRTLASNETDTYSYSITIPQPNVNSFLNPGVDNSVVVEFDTNTSDYSLNTDITQCQETTPYDIPATAFFDGEDPTGDFILIAMLSFLLSALVYKSGIGRSLLISVIGKGYERSVLDDNEKDNN